MVPSRKFLAFMSRIYSAKPSANVFSPRKHILIFFIKNPPKRKKQEAHLLFFLREDVLPFIMFALGGNQNIFRLEIRILSYLLSASSTATATATVAPTMGLLPMPRKPIISTCAGTEDEPANCASECIRPMVSVMP